MLLHDTLTCIRDRLSVRRHPPRGVGRHLQFSEHFQWWRLPEMRAYQLRKLQQLLNHCQEHVPYYADLFREHGFDARTVGSLSDFTRLPFLDKQTVRGRQEALRSADRQQWKPVMRQTAGTTGPSLRVLVGEHARQAHFAEHLRHLGWGEWHPGDPVVLFGRCEGMNPKAPWYYHRSRNWLYLNPAYLSRETTGVLVEKMARFGPVAILGAPSHLYVVSRYLAEHPVEDLRPRLLRTDTEMLYDFQRRQIEAAFGEKVRDFYRVSEQVASAAQCEGGRYHLSAETAYVEVIRPDGSHALPGEVGEIVGTNLDNYAMPLIRYRTGDLAVLAEGPCPCGRDLPALAEILGRVEEQIVTPEGLAVFDHHRFHPQEIGAVKAFQIVQEETHRYRVRVAAAPGYRPEDGERLAEAVRRAVGYPVTVEIELECAIPKTPGGRYRLIEVRVPVSHPVRERDAALAR